MPQERDLFPLEDLDIHLKSTYDHHLGLFQNKNQTVTNVIDFNESEDSKSETENKGMRVWVDTQKTSIYSIKGSIGYSRKHDGCFTRLVTTRNFYSLIFNYNSYKLIIN
uniref:Uncharacterized protein n=1 Tax=Cyprinus carpio TaxID=7962 RepID=A0A8C2HQV9_CYPCA